MQHRNDLHGARLVEKNRARGRGGATRCVSKGGKAVYVITCAWMRIKRLGGTEAMAQSEKFLLRKYKVLSLDH